MELELHLGPASAVELAAQAVSALLPPDRVQLGGGTALEARWHHRGCERLEFLTNDAALGSLLRFDAPRVDRRLTPFTAGSKAQVRSVAIAGGRALLMSVRGVGVTLSFVEGFEAEPMAHEKRTGIRISEPVDVLAKRLHLGLVRSRYLLGHDVYDLLVASHEAPEALAKAWGALPKGAQYAALSIMADVAAAERRVGPGDRWPVPEPAYPALVDDLWGHAHRLFSSDFAARPDLTPPDVANDQNDGLGRAP